jgi:hypothetical protein
MSRSQRREARRKAGMGTDDYQVKQAQILLDQYQRQLSSRRPLDFLVAYSLHKLSKCLGGRGKEASGPGHLAARLQTNGFELRETRTGDQQDRNHWHS